MKSMYRDLHDIAGEIITREIGPQTRSAEVIETEYFEEWYRTFDEAFYSRDEYLWMMLNCWYGWTRQNVVNAIKFFNYYWHREVRSFVDVGAGIGLSTLQLAKAFPHAKIFYHNLPGVQMNIAKRILEAFKIDNVLFVSSFDAIDHVDVTCVFEVMEHFKAPTKFIEPLINNTNFVFDASSFSIESPGHFPEYEIDGVTKHNKATKKLWNKWLRNRGFEQAQIMGIMPRQFFNFRPNVWARVDHVLETLRKEIK